ncbi:hypothetical protein M407DRAFT_224992 [Tulasnella calospora MUT 4182]|uniref:DUF974-domain-containing protein n=1 Tax=Tulasnella calospora MUT 4182 TaxID=1051891 RepID=A0A0C3QR63_9AGAM|nr:hypothetical protein M407DRAFT_224992 [Tulasnella calospora MUT 4182]
MEISHLLSLKVMRVSKPTLATSPQPFFSTSPSLSAHSSASLLSLQGSRPLPGHPKTLRDFSLTELLTLPSTFGAISLGETFSSAFCINNECEVEVAGVHLRMEIQTTTTKLLLADFGGLEKTLKPGESLEGVIGHEIKELNQHVLACTVSYLLPDVLGNNHNTGPPENPDRPNLRVFRKFYKFTVSNPLSVKTKVHVPKSPTALMSRTEREKVFLEVHVQNLTSEPLCFEKMKLDCVEGWTVEDANLWDSDAHSEDSPRDSTLSTTTVFSGAMAIMQPQDTRQYLFILSPKPEAIPEFPVIHQPGNVIPLGRLDISWRTGRLLTSVLSRRIPLLPMPPPAPAIPPHLQQTPRPQSPGPNAYRPSSPAFRVRNQPTARPQSPGTSHSALPSANPQYIVRPDIEVDLVINSIPYDGISIEEPFSIDFTLTTSALLPIPRDRVLCFVVQHILPPRPAAISQSLAHAIQQTNAPLPSTPEPKSPPPPAPYALRRSLSTLSLARRSESTAWGDTGSPSIMTESGAATPVNRRLSRSSLPSPFRVDAVASAAKSGQPSEMTRKEESAVMFLGSSVVKLPAFRLNAADASPSSPPPKSPEPTAEGTLVFSLEYVALREGFCPIGGLRVLLVEDREVAVDGDVGEDNSITRMEPKVIKEWDSIGEIWAKGLS